VRDSNGRTVGWIEGNLLAWATTAGTPQAVINKLNKEIAVTLALPETGKRFAVDSAEVDIRTPAEIRKMIRPTSRSGRKSRGTREYKKAKIERRCR
jgi:tripartite-type tricarboxylate transporter receptor subunit TctC